MSKMAISRMRRHTNWIILGLLCPVVAGCNAESRQMPGGRQGGSPGAQATPEESFRNIVETIRRTVADQPGTLLSNEGGAFSRLQYHREILDELIPPDEKNERYRGRITLVTKYSYRYRPPLENDDEEADEKDGIAEIEDPLQIGEGPVDPLEQLESELTGPMDKPDLDRLVPRSLGSETEDVETNIYELEYVDGRWLVTTRFDPNEDRFMQETFEFALKRQ